MESSNNVEMLAGCRKGRRVIVGNLGSYQPGEVVQAEAASRTAPAQPEDAE